MYFLTMLSYSYSLLEGKDFSKSAALEGMSNVSLCLGGDDKNLRERFASLQK